MRPANGRVWGALLAAIAAFTVHARVAAQPAQEPEKCDRARLGELLLDLHPPASQDVRTDAMRKLAACGEPRVDGALAAAFASDPDEPARIVALRSLEQLGTPRGREVLAKALKSEQDLDIRSTALDALANLGELSRVREVLFDPQEADRLRTTALELLAARGQAPSDQDLEFLAQSTSPQVAKRAGNLLGQREQERKAKADAEAAAAAVTAPAEVAVEAPPEPESPPEPPAAVVEAAPPATEEPPPAVAEAAPPATEEPPPAVAEAAPPVTEELPSAVAEPAPPVIAEAPPASGEAGAELGRTHSPPPLGLPDDPVPDAAPEETLLGGELPGLTLGVTTSTMAGASLMSFLALLGQQDSIGVLMLTGTAGAIIGGGTAWGLSRFGITPDLADSAWYTNTTAWGTLAGYLAWAGSGSQSEKLKWGSLIAGETLGIATGIWSAAKYSWTPEQMVLANSMVLGGALTLAGGKLLANKIPGVTLPVAIGTPLAMTGSAIAARYIDPSREDLHLIGVSTMSAAWTASLLASGIFDERLLAERRNVGGAVFGLGAGYLASVIAAPFVEPSLPRLYTGLGGMLAGNAFGFGLHMALEPGEPKQWGLGAGAAGAVLGLGAFVLEPWLEFGTRAPSMTTMGGLYGAATWWLAMRAAYTGGPVGIEDWRTLYGGMLAGSVGTALTGLVASRWFEPGAGEQLTTFASTGLGMGAGLGAVRLLVEKQGGADSLGVLAGAAAGFGTGALFSHSSELRGADVTAGLVGAGYGSLIGALAPSLGEDVWSGNRRTGGGTLLGGSLGALGATAAAHALGADYDEIGLATLAGVYGMGIGTGAGLAWPTRTSRSTRIGTVAGTAGLPLLALAVDPALKLTDGLGPKALAMGSYGLLVGAGYGMVASAVADPSGRLDEVPARQLWGGALFGASTASAAGLVLSKYFAPEADDFAVATAATSLGGMLGLGVPLLALDAPGRFDSVGLLSGSLAGLLGGAIVGAASESRGADWGAGVTGLGYGALLGTLIPTLGEERWDGGRRAAGGALAGGSVLSIGAATAAHLTGASGDQVRVPATSGVFGLGMGTGAGMMLDPRSGQGSRIGAVAGTSALLLGSLAADRLLHLSDGLGPSAGMFAVLGGSYGAMEGLLLANTLRADDEGFAVFDQRGLGGALLGASTGTAASLVLSKYFDPEVSDFATAGSAGALGGAMGLGVPLLALERGGRPDRAGLFAGSLVGLAGGAVTARYVDLDGVDAAAGAVAMAYGGLVGTLAPTLHLPGWEASRRTGGGSLVGLSAGATLGTMVAHATDATAGQVRVPAIASLLGLGTGLGAGWMLPTPGSQPARIGTVAGIGGFGAGSLLLDRKLKLSEGLGESAGTLGTLSAVLGSGWGLMLAGAIDNSRLVGDTEGGQLFGGALMGGSAGIATGLALSKLVTLQPGDVGAIGAGAIVGATFGRGLAMVSLRDPRDADTWSMLGGSMLGAAGVGIAQRYSPIETDDGLAATVGTGFGGLVGTLAPSLLEPRFSGLDRPSTGGLLLGASAGAIAGTVARHATDAGSGQVLLATLGGLDGAATGVGLGMALERPGSTQPERIGLTVGALAGLAIGSTAWQRTTLGPGDDWLVASGTSVGAWYGLWLPALGSGDLSDFSGYRMTGGLLAGAGLGSFATSLLAPAIEAEPDLFQNAIVLGALLSGAGAGTGAVASDRDDRAIGAMLGTGAVGLLLGGALHEQIELDSDDNPLLTLTALEGVWLGGWLPLALRPYDDLTSRHFIGGAGAGITGGLGAGILLSSVLELDSGEAGMAALTSAIGASTAAGLAFLPEGTGTQLRTSLMLGGTAAGLTAGAFLAPRLSVANNALGAATLGGLLGVSEALAFAWASETPVGDQWLGAGLLGGGLGTTLGLAAAVFPWFSATQAPAAASFAAWGAWIGSFSGALVDQDRHEVTFGGLVGANAGFAIGYGLLRTELIEPRDIGWLSLFGGMGTLLGGAGGAIFSTRDRPQPVLAGLAAGPVAGMIVGAIALPKLRTIGNDEVERDERERRERKNGAAARIGDATFSTGFSRTVGVAEWSPMVGNLPPMAGQQELPTVIGVTGKLW